MRRRLISLIVTIGLATTLSMQVLAEPLTDKLNNQTIQLQQQKNTYKTTQDNALRIEASIEILDSDIGNMSAQVDITKKQIINTEKKIEITTKKIQIAEKNIQTEQGLYNERMRIMYMNGADSYLEVILNSKGVEDFISRADNVKRIISYDNSFIKGLTTKKTKVEAEKVEIEADKTKLLVLKSENEKKLVDLKAKKSEQDKLIAETKKQVQMSSSSIASAQALVNDTLKQIHELKVSQALQQAEQIKAIEALSKSQKVNVDKLMTTSANYSPVRGSSPINNTDLVLYACNFLGTPYVWGAAGPKNFDCSGLMQYVYAHFGISLTRTTFTQIHEGVYVERQDLQPGDLIFFGTQANPHHVGMYVGNNCYIQAPRTGDVIKISALTRPDYLTARRIR